MQGVQYRFVPTASDADGDPLTFTIENAPPWASFNPQTGRLQGTPSAGDVGTYENIRISVSDGRATTSLASFSIRVVATAGGSATLTWQPPTQRTDGTPLTDLAGYKVYWGTAPNDFSSSITISNPGISTYVIENLTPATWYFVATAVDSKGLESGFSNVASKVIR